MAPERAWAIALLGTVALTALDGCKPSPHALIPRQALFGNPSRTAATISPDGRYLAFLAPRADVMNIWVAPVDALDKAKPVTAETSRPIREFLWSPDSQRLLYLQDKGGTEDYLLYGVSRDGGPTRAYTPFAKTRVEIVRVSPEVKDAILIGINNRDPAWHDIYRLQPASGKLTLVWRNPGGYAGVVADRKLDLVLAQKSLPDGGGQYERFGPDGRLTKLFDYGLDDSETTKVAGARDRARAYMLDSRGRNTAALSELDLATGATRKLAESPKADVGDTIVDPRTGEVEAYSVDYLKTRWLPLRADAQADIAFLDRTAKGQWSVASQSADDRFWTVLVDPVVEPARYYLYDRKTRKLTELFTTRPELAGGRLAAMHPLEIRTRDGLTLPSYLTLPPGSDPQGGGRPSKPLPMVLFVHGGPWARDDYGFSDYAQWLANRGYAVLQVNYRGSTGFGKNFVKAGDLEWGRKMHQDLLDAVVWAVREKIAAPGKVAIMGGSYGGYATLAGMTMTPDRFACGVDVVGPSNLFTLLQTIPPYWKAAFEQFARRMGDPRTSEGKALLRERSPLTYADKITRPLLIGQGANDPRVNVRESDQIVAAMKAKSIPVTYVVFPDEGHGFQRAPNRIAFNAVAEGFLASCLGGAAQPIGGDLKGSSLMVKAGADQVAGLEAALASNAKH